MNSLLGVIFDLGNLVKFNYDISPWDTTAFTCMNRMFASASTFNRDLSNWVAYTGSKLDRSFTGAPSMPDSNRMDASPIL